MYTILHIKTFIITFLYQLPGLPGGGNPDVDATAAPIDNHLIIGLLIGVFFIILFKFIKKPITLNNL